MELYHGTSYIDIEQFKIIKRKTEIDDGEQPDLGSGVYFTRLLQQAKDRSCKKVEGSTGAVYKIDINLNLLNGINKPSPDDDYLLLCGLSRINLSDVAIETIDNYEQCDYIYGKVIKKTYSFEEWARRFIYQDDNRYFNSNDWNELINEFRKNIEFDVEKEQYCFKSAKALKLINSSIKEIYYTKRINGKVEIIKKKLIGQK